MNEALLRGSEKPMGLHICRHDERLIPISCPYKCTDSTKSHADYTDLINKTRLIRLIVRLQVPEPVFISYGEVLTFSEIVSKAARMPRWHLQNLIASCGIAF